MLPRAMAFRPIPGNSEFYYARRGCAILISAACYIELDCSEIYSAGNGAGARPVYYARIRLVDKLPIRLACCSF
jgi:hypothetical protein